MALYYVIIWHPLCTIPHSVCNATQCIILYTVCNLHNMCDYTITHLSVTQKFVVYNICRICCLRSIYTQCVISHTLFNLCVCFCTNLVCFYTHCVVLHTFSLLGQINLDLCYFVAKSVYCNLRIFRCKFHSPKNLLV